MFGLMFGLSSAYKTIREEEKVRNDTADKISGLALENDTTYLDSHFINIVEFTARNFNALHGTTKSSFCFSFSIADQITLADL